MDMVFYYILTAESLKVNGKTIKETAKASRYTKMVINTMEALETISLMALVFIVGPMVKPMKANGYKAVRMDLVSGKD